MSAAYYMTWAGHKQCRPSYIPVSRWIAVRFEPCGRTRHACIRECHFNGWMLNNTNILRIYSIIHKPFHHSMDNFIPMCQSVRFKMLPPFIHCGTSCSFRRSRIWQAGQILGECSFYAKVGFAIWLVILNGHVLAKLLCISKCRISLLTMHLIFILVQRNVAISTGKLFNNKHYLIKKGEGRRVI